MLALGGVPLLPLPLSLLFWPVTKFEPTTAFTAVLLAYKKSLLSPIVAPAADALAPMLLLVKRVLSTFSIAPPAEATAPPLFPYIRDSLTIPILGTASSTPLPLLSAIVVRSTDRATKLPPLTLMPLPLGLAGSCRG